jgi:hypothetical protein
VNSNDRRHWKNALRLPCLLVVALVAASAIAKNPGLPPRVPPDISAFVTPDQLKALDAGMRPYVEQARKTFPEVQARFLAGLPKGQSLFVMARLYDECTRSELAFISVTRIQEGIIEGRIWSNLPHIITSYRFRDWYAFPETQLVDWLIAHPDGTEEGNIAGKFPKAPK